MSGYGLSGGYRGGLFEQGPDHLAFALADGDDEQTPHAAQEVRGHTHPGVTVRPGDGNGVTSVISTEQATSSTISTNVRQQVVFISFTFRTNSGLSSLVYFLSG